MNKKVGKLVAVFIAIGLIINSFYGVYAQEDAPAGEMLAQENGEEDGAVNQDAFTDTVMASDNVQPGEADDNGINIEISTGAGDETQETNETVGAGDETQEANETVGAGNESQEANETAGSNETQQVIETEPASSDQVSGADVTDGVLSGGEMKEEPDCEHVFTEEVLVEPSCTDGLKHLVCNICGWEKEEEIPAVNEHQYGEWIVVKEATEEVPGERERICEVCQEKESEVLPVRQKLKRGAETNRNIPLMDVAHNFNVSVSTDADPDESGAYDKDTSFSFHIEYELKDSILRDGYEGDYLNYSDRLTYSLILSGEETPITILKAVHAQLVDSEGVQAGSCDIDTNGTVGIRFYTEYLEERSQVQGSIDFQAKLNKVPDGGGGDVVIKFPGEASVTIPVVNNSGVTGGSKTYRRLDNGNIEFTIELSLNSDVKNVILTDTMGECFSFVADSFRIDGNAMNGETIEVQGNQAKIYAGDLGKGKHSITYEAAIAEGAEKETENNRVEWTYGSDGRGNASIDVPLMEPDKLEISKSGRLVQGKLEWTIKVSGTHLGGKVVEDTLDTKKAKHAYDAAGGLTVTDEKGGIVDKMELKAEAGSFTYQFPDNIPDGTYLLVYYTIPEKLDTGIVPQAQVYGNSVTINGVSVSGSYTSGEAVNPGSLITKKRISSDGNQAGWRVELQLGKFTEGVENLVIQDFFGENQKEMVCHMDSLVVENQGRELSSPEDYTVELLADHKFNLHFNGKINGKLTFTYNSTADLKQNYKNYTNTAAYTFTYNDHQFSGKASASVTMSKEIPLVKQPVTSEAGFRPAISDGVYLLTWEIYVNVKPNGIGKHPSYDLGGNTVTVEDVLPEGLRYIETQSIREVTTLGLQGKDIKSRFELPEKNTTGKITYTFPNMGYIGYYIQIRTAVDPGLLAENIGKTLVFPNTASLWVDGKSQDITAQASQTVKVTEELLKKTGTQKVDGDRLVTYSILVNKQGVDLLPGKDVLNLEDTLSKQVRFIEGSVKVNHMIEYQSGKETVGGEMQEGTDYKVSYSYSSRKLSFQVPDGKALRITYQVAVENADEPVTNTVVLTGREEIQGTTSDQWQITDASFQVTGQKNSMGIRKTDADTGRKLPDAQFAVYRVNMNTGSETFLHKGNTGNDGKLVFKSITGPALYKVQELKAPAGYVRAEQPYYYYIRGNDTTADKETEIKEKFNERFQGQELHFINDQYIAEIQNSRVQAEITLQGEKRIQGDGASLEEGAFSFLVLDKDTGNKLASGKNRADGTIAFEKIKLPVLTDGTYTLLVKEEAGSKAGYTYDSTEYEVTVGFRQTSEDKWEAIIEYPENQNQVVFTNIYTAPDAVEAVISASKELTGKDLEAGQFTFLLKDEKGQELQRTVNDKEGNIRFEAISYTQPGVFRYSISEEVPDTIPAGYTYDRKEAAVVVTVTLDEERNEFMTEITYPTEDAVFRNQFIRPETDPVEVVLQGTKFLEGAVLTEGEFSFTVTDQNGTQVSRGSSSADGSIIFTPIRYEAEGVYNYTVSEEIPAEVPAGYTYDTAVYQVIVYVTLNDSYQLDTEVVYPEGDIQFTNIYEEPKVPDSPDQPTDRPDTPQPGDTPSNVPQPEEPEEAPPLAGVLGIMESPLTGVLGISAAPETAVLGESKGPGTGDGSPVIFWSFIFLGAAALLCGSLAVGVGTKKEKNK